MMVYNFNAQSYKNIFDKMYGSGMFDKGMATASQIGRTTAEAKYAQEDYQRRLKEAQEAAEAEAAKQAAADEAEQSLDVGYDDLIEQFKKEKERASQTGLDKYYADQSKRLNKGRSKARKKVEDILPGVIPSVRDNKSLTAWDKMKLMER